jgi:hypothetical protein
MKYLLMVHHDEDVLTAIGESELQQMRAESVRLANEINSHGQYVDAAPLQPAATGMCVRMRDGQPLITDVCRNARATGRLLFGQREGPQ